MGGFSLIHWLVLGVIILLLFGGNRFSAMMSDVAKGLKGFKQGLADDPPASLPTAKVSQLEQCETGVAADPVRQANGATNSDEQR